MTAPSTNPAQWTFIKVISASLITTALGLMGWKGYAIATSTDLPAKVNTWVWIGLGLVVLHAIESIIAARIATSKGNNPTQSALYTFFTGMAGLADTYNANTQTSKERAST